MERLKSFATRLRGIFCASDAPTANARRVVKDQSHRDLPASFPDGSAFYLFATRRYAYIPSQGWFAVGPRLMRFVQETRPVWPDTHAQQVDEHIFRATLAEDAQQRIPEADYEDHMNRALREAWSKVKAFPGIPDRFPVGSKFWVYESTPYVFIPNEGWFQARERELVFYDDGEIPLHLSTYGARISESEFREHIAVDGKAS